MICDWRDSADLNHLRGSPRMALACSLCELCLESPVNARRPVLCCLSCFLFGCIDLGHTCLDAAYLCKPSQHLPVCTVSVFTLTLSYLSFLFFCLTVNQVRGLKPLDLSGKRLYFFDLHHH